MGAHITDPKLSIAHSNLSMAGLIGLIGYKIYMTFTVYLENQATPTARKVTFCKTSGKSIDL